MTDYIKNLENPNHNVFRREPLELLVKLVNEAHVENGVLRWNMGNIVPADIAELAVHTNIVKGVDLEATEAARSAHLADFLSDYIDNRANMSDEAKAEELYEMRAAFGEGETVVNVFTGEKFEL